MAARRAPQRKPHGQHTFTNRVLTPAQIGGLMLQMGWPTDQLAPGIAVALAESGGDRMIVSPTGDYGLWQINKAAHGSMPLFGQWQNAVANTQMAKAVYDDAGGWQPWATAHIGGQWSGAVAPTDPRSPAGRHILTAKRAAQQAIHGPSMELGLHEITPAEVAVGTAGAITHSLGDVWTAIVNLLQWLADPHNWLRIVEVVAGGTALLVGAYLLARSGAAGDGIKKAAGDAKSAAMLAATKGAAA